ncbi:hypothetical protein [Paenibacillus sp. ACRRY]|uniref:hypothetical protein n=1 Tax=Paenibacillus sp. ACRRY TaxID=2918208 RepID=UPI001EF4089A|nr:hypothetical protein [Paenibacillus sp. ACRRY]MCG7382804.1 hypothetical protein [Paenibacillus sp. ACRRY]
MKKMRIPVIMLTWLLITSGCASATYEITGYTSSSIIADIPVPTNAKALKVTSNSANPNIKISETYELKHIGGEQGTFEIHEMKKDAPL